MSTRRTRPDLTPFEWILGGCLVAVWIAAVVLLIHGVIARDLWEVIAAVVGMVILMIIRAVTGEVLR